MGSVFDTGFTDLSYFNITKVYTEKIYENAVNAPSNTNAKIKTKGLKFQFVEDSEVNACAFLRDNYDYMRINTGTLVTIYSLLHSAFSNPNVFPNIGDARKETGCQVNGFFDSQKKQILFDSVPIDENRKMISEFASLLATRFIAMHELGHLLNGHTHYIGTLKSNYYIEMIVKEKLSKISNKIDISYALDRRTMEMDADAFAATNSMTNLIGLFQNKESFNLIFDHMENPYQIFELWSFVIHLIFMEFERYAESDYSKYCYYLPNSARELLCHSSAINALEAQRNSGYFSCSREEVELIENYMIKGIQRAENYFNSVYNTDFNFIVKILDPKFIDYVDEVQNHWNNKLRHNLQKFSRALLYDPNGMKI